MSQRRGKRRGPSYDATPEWKSKAISAMADRGITKADLAEMLGVSRTAVSDALGGGERSRLVRRIDNILSQELPSTDESKYAPIKSELADLLRNDAQQRGVSWDELLARAGLSKASRSRLNNGVVGLPIISKVRATLDGMSPPLALPSAPVHAPDDELAAMTAQARSGMGQHQMGSTVMRGKGPRFSLSEEWRYAARQSLKAKGWNQSRLARALGVTRATVSSMLGTMSGAAIQSSLRPRASELLGIADQQIGTAGVSAPVIDVEPSDLHVMRTIAMLDDGDRERVIDWVIARYRKGRS